MNNGPKSYQSQAAFDDLSVFSTAFAKNLPN